MKPFYSMARKSRFFVLGMVVGLTTLAFHIHSEKPSQTLQYRLRKITQLHEVSKGVFIVADPRIADPNFSQTVVLMLQHDAEGSLGLIINRPTDTPLSRLLPEEKTDFPLSGSLYTGGPVMQGTLTVLFQSSAPPKHLDPVFGQVYASQEARVFVEQLQTGSQNKFRLYSGYAGWGPGQLRAEMNRGDWRIVEGDADVIFNRPNASIWSEMFSRAQELVVWAAESLLDS